MVKAWACVAGLLLLGAMPMAAQAPGISEVYARISAEETNNSKIMWIIHEIADVHGPRVTGTPNLKAADDWAVKTMASWGLANTHLESWTFQPPSAAAPVSGWENVELLADAVAPFHGQLMVEPLAWTPTQKELSPRKWCGSILRDSRLQPAPDSTSLAPELRLRPNRNGQRLRCRRQ